MHFVAFRNLFQVHAGRVAQRLGELRPGVEECAHRVAARERRGDRDGEPGRDLGTLKFVDL